MSNRYMVEITTPVVTSVIVVADSIGQASERALKGEGNVTGSWTENAEATRTKVLEE